MSQSSLLYFINSEIDEAVNTTDYNLTFNYLLQGDIYIVATTLRVCTFIDFQITPAELEGSYPGALEF